MHADRIEFISAYCDRWCERCAFTTRCSAYAVHAALAMCDGDFAAAIELAVGAPPDSDQAGRQRFELRLSTFQEQQRTGSASSARLSSARHSRAGSSRRVMRCASAAGRRPNWTSSPHPTRPKIL